MDHQGGEFHLMKEKCCYIFKNKCRGTFSIKNLKRCFPYISTVLRVSYFKKVSFFSGFRCISYFNIRYSGGSRYLKPRGGGGGVVGFRGGGKFFI